MHSFIIFLRGGINKKLLKAGFWKQQWFQIKIKIIYTFLKKSE
jgi:hypothetical protein